MACIVLHSYLASCIQNRGVVTGHKVHRICEDVITNKTSESRYAPCKVIRVPEKARAEWRRINREKADDEPLLPAYSDQMEYAMLSQTHFSHAQKLLKEGRGYLYNEGVVPLKVQTDDEDAKNIARNGLQCIVYDEELWTDPRLRQLINNTPHCSLARPAALQDTPS